MCTIRYSRAPGSPIVYDTHKGRSGIGAGPVQLAIFPRRTSRQEGGSAFAPPANEGGNACRRPSHVMPTAVFTSVASTERESFRGCGHKSSLSARGGKFPITTVRYNNAHAFGKRLRSSSAGSSCEERTGGPLAARSACGPTGSAHPVLRPTESHPLQTWPKRWVVSDVGCMSCAD
jgi:hypothetical protein